MTRATPPMLRALDRVLVGGSGCWMWLGCRDRFGYGYITVDKHHIKAHRLFYEFLRGPIPQGLVSDHLCRVPSCVKPSHIEPVTQAENVRRGDHTNMRTNAWKTHCIRGHEFTPENTLIRMMVKRGRSVTERGCRTCKRTAYPSHYPARAPKQT